jgi:hypothetical protein
MHASTVMRWITLPLLFILNAGPSMHWGDVGAGVQAALLWSAGMGAFVVLAGWRAGKKGPFISLLYGMVLAATVNVPAYFAGRWIATQSVNSLRLDCSLLDTLFGAAIKQLVCGG